MTAIDKQPIALSTIPKPGPILQPCSLPCRPRIKHNGKGFVSRIQDTQQHLRNHTDMLRRTSVRTTTPTYERHSSARPIEPPHQCQQRLPTVRCTDNVHHGLLAVRSQERSLMGRGQEWWLISSYAHRRTCYNKYNTISYNLLVSTDTHQSSSDETSSKTL